MKNNLHPAILLLNDGEVYKGWSFTNTFTSYGEVVFNTGMTGYQEIMTDPSYCSQIIIFTYPEIGNTGINNDDNESSKIHIKGIIAKNICINSYNWRKSISLHAYLTKHNIPHIFGIDTRKLTKYIRDTGVMQGCISSKLLNIKDLKANLINQSYKEETNKIKQVTTSELYKLSRNNLKLRIFSYLDKKTNIQLNSISKYRILVIDFGVKTNILRRLLEYKCEVCIIPATSSYNLMLNHKPDGILISNGPGDPSINTYIITNIQKIIHYTNIPIFGICMGHQIICLALGYKTFKLKFGHRGLNHPSGIKQSSEITSQNHGFAVNLNTNTNSTTQITHLNLNDSTIGGLLHINKPIFSVQHHPEASPGPHDSDYLFTAFLKVIKLTKQLGKQT